MTWARKTGAGLTLSASCAQPQARRGLLPSSASSRGGSCAKRGNAFVIASSARLPRLTQCSIALVDPCDGGRTASAPRRGPRRRAVEREPRGEMRRVVSRHRRPQAGQGGEELQGPVTGDGLAAARRKWAWLSFSVTKGDLLEKDVWTNSLDRWN